MTAYALPAWIVVEAERPVDAEDEAHLLAMEVSRREGVAVSIVGPPRPTKEDG